MDTDRKGAGCRLSPASAARTRLRSTMKMRVLRLVGIALLSSLQSAQAADIYRYRDANNVTTYSQLPPVGAVYVERLMQDSNVGAAALNGAPAGIGWRAVSPRPVQVQAVAQIGHSGVRAAQTPAEQELSERLEQLAEVGALLQETLRPPQRGWVETTPQPRRRALN